MDSYTVTGGDGVELVVDAVGPTDARPIVFVHGYSQSRLCWTRQFESALADAFRLVAFDIRGHGDSEKPTGAYADPRLWADDVRAVLDGLDRDDPVLVGWSYGGLIISDYLSVYGTANVSGANYVGAISEKGTEDAARFGGEEFVALADGFNSTDAETCVETLATFVDLCVEEPLDPNDLHFMLGYNVKTPPHVREALQARAVENEATLRGLDVPVLLTHGEADPVVLPGAAKKHADLIPDAELSLYADVGHSPFFERPERFNGELRAFVETL